MSRKERELLLALDAVLLEHPRIQLSRLARKLGVERHWIERAVRKVKRQSFQKLQQEYVLRKALHLLSGRTDQSIKEIAYDLDYQWPEDFSRFIKRATGHTPSEIRNQSRVLGGTTPPRLKKKRQCSANAR